MMFRRTRSAPQGMRGLRISFRLATLAIGLTYVLATTDTIKTVQMAIGALTKVGAMIEAAGASTKPDKQHAGSKND